MLPSPYLRPLLRALTGLIFSVSGLLVLTLVLLLTVPADEAASATATTAQKAVASPQKAKPAGYESGKLLFINNCAQCHAVTEETVVGPGLQGVRQRTPGDQWLQRWIRNSSAVIASGDPYAVGIYNKFNRVQMTSFGQLTDQNISDMLTYIDAANSTK